MPAKTSHPGGTPSKTAFKMNTRPGRVDQNMCVVEHWLNTRNVRFGGKNPLEVVCEEGARGARRVAYELEQLALKSAEVLRESSKMPKKRRACARSSRTFRP
jgi:hypothetical protein